MDTPQDAQVGATMGRQSGRGLLIAGGLCAILWPLLSTVYYAAYAIAAGGAMLPQPGSEAGFATRAAELGQRPAIVTLDWIYAALPLLLWPFFAALYRLLNQMSSLLYQGCVALISLALIRSRTWRAWGWAGLVGALLALPAKLPLGLRVPTNAIWTGLAYGLWPVAVGVGLLRAKEMGESTTSG